MKKMLLTSAGFENPNIENVFLQLIEKKPENIKALWIPTAAIDDEARAVLPKCKSDLLNAGICEQNIVTYNLDRKMVFEELKEFNTVYFCGGNSEYLLQKIHEVKFDIPLKSFIENGGVYVGVSAGSVIAANNLPNNLGLLNCSISVHCENGTKIGNIDTKCCSHISLTNNQAILILGENIQIIQ